MAKHTVPIHFPTGSDIAINPFFIYEVTIYIIYKGRIELYDSQYYRAKSPLKHSRSEYKKIDKDRIVAKIIDLLAAPEDYIKLLSKK